MKRDDWPEIIVALALLVAVIGFWWFVLAVMAR